MKKVFFAGFIGGLVFLIWFIIVDGILGFKGSIEMHQLGNEHLVYTHFSVNT